MAESKTGKAEEVRKTRVLVLEAFFKEHYSMRNKSMNPPLLPPQLNKMIGRSIEDARIMAKELGYRVEVLISVIRSNAWEEKEKTGWVNILSSYAPDKINDLREDLPNATPMREFQG